MRIARHVSELIGNTPLVQLNSVVPEGAGTVAAKIEYLNPGGSAKDRIARQDDRRRRGQRRSCKPGGTIVEPTSGNTGVGLALVAQQRGYHCIFVCPDKVSEDKRNVLRAYGAEVVVCPTAVAPDDPDSYYSVSDRLVGEIDGAWKPDQYSNPSGPASHYETTGPEIWADTDGKVTHFVAGVGTGGTITGTGRYLKEVSGGHRSGRSAPTPRARSTPAAPGGPYLVEGVGEDFWPSAYDPTRARRDRRGLRRRLVRDDPAAGPRGGAAGRRLLRHGRRRGARGRRARRAPTRRGRAAARRRPRLPVEDLQRRVDGVLRLPAHAPDGHVEPTVGDVLRGKSGELPDLVHTHPTETVRDAIDILREYGVSQMPVCRREPPVMAGEVAGSVSERELLSAVFEGRAHARRCRVEQHMSPPLPLVGAGEPVSAAAQGAARMPTRSWWSTTANRSAC